MAQAVGEPEDRTDAPAYVGDVHNAGGDAADIHWAWYLLALAVYVVGGYLLKSWLLNWIIGPLFLLLALYVVPMAARRLLRSRSP